MSVIDDVLKYIATNEIRWIDLQFYDIKGSLHRVTVSNRKIEESSFGNGIYAADLFEVFGNSNQGELVLLPDPETLARLPWETSTVRLLCDVVVSGNKEKFVKDPRYVAERMETNLGAAGIKSALLGSEMEFYLFDSANADKLANSRGTGVLVDSREASWSPFALSSNTKGAYLATPNDLMYGVRNQIAESMEDNFGMPVDAHRHGRSKTAQQTFELSERSLKSAADATNTLKFATKNIAAALNLQSSFMPYPISNEKGSSLNASVSLWKSSDSNLFYDAKDDYAQLSQSGRYFVGGLLEHSSALAAFCAPTPNSYGRLAADPKRFGWSATKKDSLVFIPCGKRNVKEVKRVVFTLPDPSANPYLAFSAIVAAGLDGIKNKTEPGDPAEVESKKRVEKKLPMSLSESISALNSDSKFIKGIISNELLDDFNSLKLKQHSKSLLGVSATEMVEYFNV